MTPRSAQLVAALRVWGTMNRHASVVLRRKVDEAVGPGYDQVFLRLDLLLAGREARCPCASCSSRTAEARDRLLASLPPL